MSHRQHFLVMALLAVNVVHFGLGQVLQPNTTLNEFKNATIAMATNDPGDEAVTCNLTSKDLAAADLAVVAEDCAAVGSASPRPGSSFCTSCGCALNLLAYKTLNKTGALHAMSEANDDMLDACATWVFQQAVQQGAVTPAAAAALEECAPLDFICGKASKRLNTSLITGNMTDRLSLLGGAISDAVEEAAAGALPSVAAAASPAAAAAARSWSAAARASFAVLLPAAVAFLLV